MNVGGAVAWSKLRQFFSRNQWLVWLWRLPQASTRGDERGLILIQIDGLARRHVELAIQQGRMPFLRQLQRRQRYQIYSFYSGLPSSTPAVQGELFYGVKCAVPAFSFLERSTGTLHRMYYQTSALRVENEIAGAEPLLRDGSSYSNVYSGGASEAHFCATTLGWGGVLEKMKPSAVVGLMLLYPGAILRTLALMVIEFSLAGYDFLRGLIAGRNLMKELVMIPTRVLVCIFLRELISIGIQLDVARGLPVIHANLLGYDEHAHRRGPSSGFAYWTLKGIDHVLHTIWRAAMRSGKREYDLWIYSDHGQEETIPYPRYAGESLESAIARVIGADSHVVAQSPSALPLKRTIQGSSTNQVTQDRARWLKKKSPSHPTRVPADGDAASSRPDESTPTTLAPPPLAPSPPSYPVVAGMGPIAHVYLDPAQAAEVNLVELAQRLVAEAQMPWVLLPSAAGQVRAFSQAGEFLLPQDADAVIGPAHPFLTAVAEDLCALCHHPDAGDLVLSGWRTAAPPISFPHEHGAHAGPGATETHGFALLPPDAELPPLATINSLAAQPDTPYLRPLDLRFAVLAELGHRPLAPLPRSSRRRPSTPRPRLRIMTYNVHYCVGLDRQMSVERIARVIRQADPDVVALQELDTNQRRSGQVDQVERIAELLAMECYYHPAWRIAEEEQGDAVLSRLPMRLQQASPLPADDRYRLVRPRGALWVEIDFDGRPVQLINTHLDLFRRQQEHQLRTLLGDHWLAHPQCQSPAVLCGDFNFGPRSPNYRLMPTTFRDAQTILANHQPQSTWRLAGIKRRIDHIWVTAELTPVSIDVVTTRLAQLASDHLPLVVDLELTE